MTSVPDVSVIVPAYQVEAWITEAVESVTVGDGAERVEVVVVDDGSTDATPELVASLQQRYPGVVALRQENQGLGAARNAGVDAATGRYLAFLDGDDRYRLPALLHLVDRADAVGARFSVADRIKFPRPWVNPPWAPEMARGEQVITSLAQAPGLAFDPSVCNKLFDRSWFLAQGWRFPSRRFEDVGITVRAFASADRVLVCPDVLLEYRQRGDGTSIMDRAVSAGGVLDHLAAVEDVASMTASLDDGARRAVQRWILVRHGHYVRHAPSVLSDAELADVVARTGAVYDAIDVDVVCGALPTLEGRLDVVACLERRADLVGRSSVDVVGLVGLGASGAGVARAPGGVFGDVAAGSLAAAVLAGPVQVVARGRTGSGLGAALRGEVTVAGAEFTPAALAQQLALRCGDGTRSAVRVVSVDGPTLAFATDPAPSGRGPCALLVPGPDGEGEVPVTISERPSRAAALRALGVRGVVERLRRRIAPRSPAA